MNVTLKPLHYPKKIKPRTNTECRHKSMTALHPSYSYQNHPFLHFFRPSSSAMTRKQYCTVGDHDLWILGSICWFPRFQNSFQHFQTIGSPSLKVKVGDMGFARPLSDFDQMTQVQEGHGRGCGRLPQPQGCFRCAVTALKFLNCCCQDFSSLCLFKEWKWTDWTILENFPKCNQE